LGTDNETTYVTPDGGWIRQGLCVGPVVIALRGYQATIDITAHCPGGGGLDKAIQYKTGWSFGVTAIMIFSLFISTVAVE
jgi:hypothetical protein